MSGAFSQHFYKSTRRKAQQILLTLCIIFYTHHAYTAEIVECSAGIAYANFYDDSTGEITQAPIAGIYCNYSEWGTPCPLGYYCPTEPYAQPIYCPAGHYCDTDTDVPYASNTAFASNCIPDEHTCAAVATPCPYGTYSTGGAYKCTTCDSAPCDPETGVAITLLAPGVVYTNNNYNETTKLETEYRCSLQSGEKYETARDIVESTNDAERLSCWCRLTAPYEGAWTLRIQNGIYDCSFFCPYVCPKATYEEDAGDRSFGEFESLEDLTNYQKSFFSLPRNEALCELGISKLYTSNGLSFPLYAEPYTEPAINISYDDGICYLKLESGTGQNTINLIFNNEPYHVIE